MANIKIIDLPTGSPESTSFVEATQVDALAESGRSTVKLALNALGNFVAGQGASPLEYGDLETESTTLIGAANELHNTIGADAYDDTATYNTGELCIYNNTLYICTVSGGITTPEAWTPAHWTATTIETLINDLDSKLTPVPIAASDFFDSADLPNIDANEFFAYRLGKMVFVERCKIMNVTLVSPTYKIVGVKPEFLPTANIRICGQFEIGGQLDNPYRMFLSPVYGIGSEKWGTYSSIWLYSFSYLIA